MFCQSFRWRPQPITAISSIGGFVAAHFASFAARSCSVRSHCSHFFPQSSAGPLDSHLPISQLKLTKIMASYFRCLFYCWLIGRKRRIYYYCHVYIFFFLTFHLTLCLILIKNYASMLLTSFTGLTVCSTGRAPCYTT